MNDKLFSFWTNNRVYSALLLVKSFDFYRRNKFESTDSRFDQFRSKINEITMDMGNKNDLVYVLGKII